MINRMQQHLAAIVLLLLVFSPGYAAEFRTTSPEQVGMSSDRLKRLDEALSAYVENDQIAGQVVLVLRDGQVVFFFFYSWRDKEAVMAITEDTIFLIA